MQKNDLWVLLGAELEAGAANKQATQQQESQSILFIPQSKMKQHWVEKEEEAGIFFKKNVCKNGR